MMTPHELVIAYRTRTKKRFGQHFLSDEGTLHAIADAIALQPGEHVLEIGPGCGTLTSVLIARGARTHAIEIDRDAAAFLREQFVERGQLKLLEGDAMRVDLSALLDEAPRWKCAANLPYNVATPIFFELTRHRARFDLLALMFQKEVALRMVATPEQRKCYGALSLMTRLYYEANVALRLPPGAFLPPPKVDSALVVFEPIAESRIPDEALREVFERVVKTAFQQRRKTLGNALKPMHPDRDAIKRAIASARLEASDRAERVDFEGFVRLAEAVSALPQ